MALLDGLEAVELTFSQILEDNEKFRIDSEFFKKEYLIAYKLIKNKSHKKLKDIIDILTDFSANGSYENIAKNFTLLDKKNYAYMVRTTDLESLNFTKDVKYIDKHSYDFLNKSQIFGGELLINKIGSPGRVYMMPSLNIPVSLGMNLFMLRLSEGNYFTEEFIWAYLNCKIGKTIIKRKINGTVPLTIDKIAIKTLYIPDLSKKFQLQIRNFIKSSHKELKGSKIFYKEAENLLLKELNLLDFEPSKDNTSEKSFSESFGSSGRLDSEYYLPKYDELIERIEAQPFDELKNIVTLKKSIETGSEAYSDNGVEYIRVSNLTKMGLSKSSILIPYNYFEGEALKKLEPKKDTILLSKDGTVGIAYTIKNETNIITSGAILHLIIEDDNILPEYLTLVLNSIVVQMQSQRDAGGSIIKHWKPSEISKILIPIIDKFVQTQIEEKIKESFRLKEESEKLLELAKRAVEVAIEEGEEVAMEVINA